MAAVHPYDAREFHEYVDVDDLCILLSRRVHAVQAAMNKILKEHPVRVLYKPGENPAREGIPCFHVRDISGPLRLSEDYVEEIVEFRRKALADVVEIDLPGPDDFC